MTSCLNTPILSSKKLLFCSVVPPPRRILIDTGEADKPEYVSLLQETLVSLQASLGPVLLTHWHHDHIGGVEGVCTICKGSSPPLVVWVECIVAGIF